MFKHPLTWMVIMFCALVAFTAKALLLQQAPLFEQSQDFPEILHLVDLAYVDEIDMDDLMPGAFQGALTRIDENASYVPPEPTSGENAMAPDPVEAETVQNRTGMWIVKRDGYAYVVAVQKGSPADVQGIRAGDYLSEINGRTTRRMSAYEIRRRLKRDDDINLTILNRGSGEDRDVLLLQGQTPKASLMTRALESQQILIQLSSFYQGVAADLEAALANLKEAQTVVLDLRGAVAGNDDDLRLLARYFLEKGSLGAWKSKEGSVDLAVTESVVKDQTNLVLLVDASVSGAAERFAAVAKARKAATVVGTPTLGLADDYRRYPLSNGAVIELATRVFMAGDDRLTGEGVTPDRSVTLEGDTSDDDPFLAKALEIVATLKKAS